MPRGARSNSKILKLIPTDLTWHSTAEDALEWLSMTLSEDSRWSSSRGDKLVTLKELTIIVKHLKEHKIPYQFIENSSDDPEEVAKRLLRLADVDGNDGLNEQELGMLWDL